MGIRSGYSEAPRQTKARVTSPNARAESPGSWLTRVHDKQVLSERVKEAVCIG